MTEGARPGDSQADRPELSSRSHVVRGGAVVVVGSIVSKLVGLASAIVVARSLSIAGFGQFSFAIAYGSFFVLLADLGLDSIAVRELASRSPAEEGRLIGSVLAIKAGVIVASLAVAGAGLLLYTPSLRVGGLVASLALINALPGTMGLVLVTRLRMLPLAIIQVAGALLTISCYIAVAVWHGGPVAYLVVEAATTVATGLAIGVFASRTVHSLAVDRHLIGELLRSTAPLAISAIAVLVYRRSDQLLLPVLGNVRELGRYAGAVRIVDSLNVVPEAVAIVALPVLARRAAVGSDARMAATGFRLLASVVLPAAAVGTVVGGPIMTRVYGEGYGGAGGALAVLLWAHFFGFIGVLLAQQLVARRQEHALAALLVSAAVGNILINVWAIPRYGEMGAAWASFAAYAWPFAIGGLVGPARSAVRAALRSSLRPVVGVALLLALLVALQPDLVVALVVTAVSWPVILLITGSTSWTEVRTVFSALRQSDVAAPNDRTGPGALPFP